MHDGSKGTRPPPSAKNNSTPPHFVRAARVVTIGEAPIDGAIDADAPLLKPAEITAEALRRLQPDVVLAPLVGEGFDCFDVAEALCAAGYTGPFRAVVPYVPDPALVKREIAACCPHLDFDLVILGNLRGDGGL